MEVDLAILCDAVTIREGLFHVLGGGITFIGRPAYPAPLMCSLALRVSMHRTEASSQHPLTVVVQNADGQELGKVEGAFAANPAAMAIAEPGEALYTCLALPLAEVPLPAPGAYSIEILIDNEHKKTVTFSARMG